MAGKTAILSVKVVSDTKNAKKGLDDVGDASSKLEGRLNAATPAAVATVGAITLLGKAALDSASELQQSSGAVEAVFQDQAATIISTSKQAAESVGLATSEYQNLSVVLGSQLKNMGVPMSEIAGQTDNLVKLGADLAATFGGSTSDAVSAVSSLLRGERDPIERYGVAIKAADIEARLAAQGLGELEGEARKQAETQATLALLMEQTAGAQGAFARETDSAAGAQQIANARMEDAQAALGQKLLPAYTAVQNALASAAEFTAQHSDAVLIAIGVIGTLAAGILAANAALHVYKATQVAVKVATAVWTGAQTALNFVLSANPIGIVVLAIAALVAGIIYAYNNSETFRNGVNRLWEGIKAGASWVGSAMQPVVDIFWSVVDAVRSAYNWVADLFSSFSPPAWLSTLAGYVGLSASAPSHVDGVGIVSAAAAPARSYTHRLGGRVPTPRPAPSASPPPASIVINVTGALDPVAVAQQIRRILDQHDRRVSGVEL